MYLFISFARFLSTNSDLIFIIICMALHPSKRNSLNPRTSWLCLCSRRCSSFGRVRSTMVRFHVIITLLTISLIFMSVVGFYYDWRFLKKTCKPFSYFPHFNLSCLLKYFLMFDVGSCPCETFEIKKRRSQRSVACVT